MEFKEIKIKEFELKIFSKIDNEWMLISAEHQGEIRGMTASWGQMGTLWNKPVTTIFIRPQRNTREFVESNERFSLSFFDGHKEELSYMGSVSSKNEPDKIKKAKLHPIMFDGVPTYEEANLLIVCKKIYAQRIDEKLFLDPAIVTRNYPKKDFHYFYIGEIEKIYKK